MPWTEWPQQEINQWPKQLALPLPIPVKLVTSSAYSFVALTATQGQQCKDENVQRNEDGQ